MGPWNHNIHYHDIVLRAIPPNCRRALDVGCGQGLLARQLARHCQEVIAIDSDRDTLLRARSARDPQPRIAFVEGDAMSHPFPDASFDLITVVAALHHLPLQPALLRFRNLLRSGGVLAVVGLYRAHSIQDYAWAAAALPASWIFRCLHRRAEVEAPLQEPKETLHEIRAACDAILPGGTFRRRPLFRYSFVWPKPSSADRSPDPASLTASSPSARPAPSSAAG
jgi:ubiquinone/menaquinone biosynthesis C-methylase UbiE